MKKNYRNNRGPSKAGWTGTEVALTLLLIAIATALVMTTFSSSRAKTQEQAFIRNAIELTAAVQSRFMGQGNYNGLADDVAIDANTVPATWISGTTIKTQWGAATLAPINSDSQFTVTFSTLPEGPTNALADVTNEGWVSLSVNGTSVPFNGAVVATIAGAVTSSNTVVITVGR